MNEVYVDHKHTSTLLAFFSHNGKYLISYTDFMSSNWVLDPVYYLIKLYDSCLQNVFCTLNPTMKPISIFANLSIIHGERRAIWQKNAYFGYIKSFMVH